MSKPSLRALTIILPLLFGTGLLVLRRWVYGDPLRWEIELAILGLIGLGSALFSSWVFRLIEQRENLIRNRSIQLTALNEAALVLTMDLDLRTVLNRVVGLACELVNARYGALGVLDEDGRKIAQFITSGMEREDRDRLIHPPVGKGILGVLINEEKPIRLSDLSQDPRAFGFPANHPRMTSFLGVPIKSKGKVIGNLYLTDKIPGRGSEALDRAEFTAEDERLVEMFATQAAIAIENAQLYRKTQQLAILQERERFGMDLHDGIIQSIYAIGLMLEDTQLRMKSEPEVVSDRIQRTIFSLNEVIRDIRNYILDLRPQRFQGRDLKGGLEELVMDLRANTFLDVELATDGIEAANLTPEQTVEILHIVQEALTNVRKHAQASRVHVQVSLQDQKLLLSVADDGIGMSNRPGALATGNGLRNMRERTGVLAGEISFQSSRPHGTNILLKVPVSNGFQSRL